MPSYISHPIPSIPSIKVSPDISNRRYNSALANLPFRQKSPGTGTALSGSAYLRLGSSTCVSVSVGALTNREESSETRQMSFCNPPHGFPRGGSVTCQFHASIKSDWGSATESCT